MKINYAAGVKWDALPYLYGRGLDVGCGDFKVFPHAIGVDVKAGAGVNVIGDATKLDELFARHMQDFVFASFLLSLIKDWRDALYQLWGMVREGGHLILYDELDPNEVRHQLTRDLFGFALVEHWAEKGQFFSVYRKAPHNEFNYPAMEIREKRAAVVRPGGIGDVLWGASVCAHLKNEGYHVTLYTDHCSVDVVAHDPNIDRIIPINRAYFEWEDFRLWMSNEARKYPRFVNLVGTVDSDMLGDPKMWTYYLPDEARRWRFDKNYLEYTHRAAGVPLEPRLRFHPTMEEWAWFEAYRSGFDVGPLAVLVPCGSRRHKLYPHAPRLAGMLAADGFNVVVLGDLHELKFPHHPRICVEGNRRSIRKALTIAKGSNLVIGAETGILNAVAFEYMPKVVLLSHSSHENLTRDWRNTAAVAGFVPCYPCHRMHKDDMAFCSPVDSDVGRVAACQAAISPEAVIAAIQRAGEGNGTSQRSAA